eukprot:Clim_evm76s150 gene=Clim_evmTU76s150
MDEEYEHSGYNSIDIMRMLVAVMNNRGGGITVRMEEDSEEEDDDAVDQQDLDTVNPKALQGSAFQQQVKHDSGMGSKSNVMQLLKNRETNQTGRSQFNEVEKAAAMATHLPNGPPIEVDVDIHDQIFCGKFSENGKVFMSASQGAMIHLYDVEDNWKVFKAIPARHTGWAVVDVAFSRDAHWIIYSSWSDHVNFVNLVSAEEYHEPLLFNEGDHHFCPFSIKFSHDASEILAGANDACLYIYDMEERKVSQRFRAHDDDINCVNYLDEGRNIILSGSDDSMCKVWDRRALSNKKPIGKMAGHNNGLTCIDPKHDERHFITTSKDQSIKLWDIRKMSDPEAHIHPSRYAMGQWDYRSSVAFNRGKLPAKHKHDTSIMTYRGMSIQRTLIRSYFSPKETTGQRYIYSGSYDGTVYIFDSLTGEIVKRLEGHRHCVRDVSWHPYRPQLVSVGFDCTVKMWNHESLNKLGTNERPKARRHHRSNETDSMDEDDHSFYDEDDDDDDDPDYDPFEVY